MYVYIQKFSQDNVPYFEVGYFLPNSNWQFESQFALADEAAERLNYLNGGRAPNPELDNLVGLINQLEPIIREVVRRFLEEYKPPKNQDEVFNM